MKRLSRIALALVLPLCLVCAVACSSPDATDSTQDTSVETEEDAVPTDEDESEARTDAPDTEAKDDDEAKQEAAEPKADEATQHVGADGVGFVDIPASWKEFHDVEGGDDLQWCDGTPYTIITLNVIDPSETLSGDDLASFTPEDAANNLLNHLIEEGMDEESASGSYVTLAGREAVQGYGFYPDGSFLVFWLVEDDEGHFRYVAAEGTSDTIMDAVTLVEESYTL